MFCYGVSPARRLLLLLHSWAAAICRRLEAGLSKSCTTPAVAQERTGEVMAGAARWRPLD